MQNLDILKGLEGELKKARLLRTPVIYIHPSLGDEQTQVLRDIARKLEAVVVEEDSECHCLGGVCVCCCRGGGTGKFAMPPLQPGVAWYGSCEGRVCC
jgi:hypothetical protein